MRGFYFDTPGAAVAVNFKVASASLARAIIAAYYPRIESVITTPHGDGQGTAYPEGKHADNKRWQGACPKVAPHERPITMVLVRDPVERYRSAVAEMAGTPSQIDDIDAHLDKLESGDWNRESHFWPQVRLLKGNEVHLYRFEDHLQRFASDAGLAWPMANIDGDNPPKPTLTTEQFSRIESIYDDDLTLHQSIASAGQVRAVPPADPEPVSRWVPPEISPAQLRSQLILQGITMVQIESLIDAIPDAQKRELLRVQWEYATVIRRNAPEIITFGQALGLSETQIDDLFIAAIELLQ